MPAYAIALQAATIDPASVQGVVTIPLWALISVITGLTAAVVYMFQLLNKSKDGALEREAARTEKVLTAVNANTAAITALTDALQDKASGR